MTLVFPVHLVDPLLHVQTLVDQRKDLAECQCLNGFLALSFINDEVFRFEGMVDLSLLFDIEEVGSD